MTAEQFTNFWNSTYPDTIPISHYFKHDYSDRWFRIHSLPESKRYADDEREWKILLDRQNKIITDLLGNNSSVLLVTGDSFFEGYTELHPLEEVKSIADMHFLSLDSIDLHKLSPDQYEPGQMYRPLFSSLIWQQNIFDNLLKEMATDQLRAFLISVANECIVAPYDGGIDIILKDEQTKNRYKTKYKKWLSVRQDGL